MPQRPELRPLKFKLPSPELILRAPGDVRRNTARGVAPAADFGSFDGPSRLLGRQRPSSYLPAQQSLLSGTVSNAATLSLVLTPYTTFRGFKIRLSGLIPATDAADFWMRLSTDGGATYESGVADYSWSVHGLNDGVARDDFDLSDSEIAINFATVGLGANNSESGDFEITLLNPSASQLPTMPFWDGVYISSTGTLCRVSGVGKRLTAQNTDAVRFQFSSGDIAEAKYMLVGLR